MRETLDSLRDYQELLTRIGELDQMLAFVPPEIVDLEQEWKGVQERLTELATKKDSLETKQRELEVKLSEANGKSQKFERDLHEVTNTKEYHAVLKEIDTAKKTLHTLTEEKEKVTRELEEVERNIEECGQLGKESRARYDKELAEYQGKMVENKKERDEKIVARDALSGKIPMRLLKQFNRIADRRAGIGLALCVSAVCQACNVRVRQNVVDQLRKFDRIHNCESCKRILYFADSE